LRERPGKYNFPLSRRSLPVNVAANERIYFWKPFSYTWIIIFQKCTFKYTIQFSSKNVVLVTMCIVGLLHH